MAGRRLLSRSCLVSLPSIVAIGIAASACNAYDAPLPPADEVVVAANPPAPLSGGTLVVAGETAVATDPDRDRVWIVDLASKQIVAEIALESGSEPGRVTSDDAGRAHVVLRSGGGIATIDLASGKLLDTREVCAAPRGIAFDPQLDAIHVACAGGELVTLPTAGGEELRRIQLDRDLRDVDVDGAGRLFVSTFRSAEILQVVGDGTLAQRHTLPPFQNGIETFAPSVAWRMKAMSGPSGGVIVAHQRAMRAVVRTAAPAYYTASVPCNNAVVHSTVSILGSDVLSAVTTPHPAPVLGTTAMPIDVASSPNGEMFAMAAAGSNAIVIADMDAYDNEHFSDCSESAGVIDVGDQPTAVAFSDSGVLVVQTRQPATLLLFQTTSQLGEPESIQLSDESVFDTGHELFHHSPTGTTSVACASCHPEGREDGLVWNFDLVGPRRTQAIDGGFLKTAPFHWAGELSDFGSLVHEVFERRMTGPALGLRHQNALAGWIDKVPTVPRVTLADPSAAERGKAIFRDPKTACVTCHSGPSFTNNETHDVGTGGALQVPALVGVGMRAPLMHDGCAKTLHDRFGPCGGGDAHGKTSHLSASEIDDLVAYLDTL